MRLPEPSLLGEGGGVGARGSGSWCLAGSRVWVWEDEEGPEDGWGEVCMTVWMDLMPPKWTLRSGWEVAFC